MSDDGKQSYGGIFTHGGCYLVFSTVSAFVFIIIAMSSLLSYIPALRDANLELKQNNEVDFIDEDVYAILVSIDAIVYSFVILSTAFGICKKRSSLLYLAAGLNLAVLVIEIIRVVGEISGSDFEEGTGFGCFDNDDFSREVLTENPFGSDGNAGCYVAAVSRFIVMGLCSANIFLAIKVGRFLKSAKGVVDEVTGEDVVA